MRKNMILTLCAAAIFTTFIACDDSVTEDDNTTIPNDKDDDNDDDKDSDNDDSKDDNVDDNGGGNAIYAATPHNSDYFTPLDNFSETFDNGGFNKANWEAPVDGFAAWGFKPENVTITEDGKLKLTVKHDEYHYSKKQKNYYFSSGMLRSKRTMTYGYYEARIKGADIYPGTCSAFWLYTKGVQRDKKPWVVKYNEIDIIEIQQYYNKNYPEYKRKMASNIHVYAYTDQAPKEKFCSAGKYPKMGRTSYMSDFDAEDDYHIYACENRPDSIVFYIDGVRTGAKKNHYWHLKEGMYVTLSLGLRTPYEHYDDKGNRTPVETSSEEANRAGFPHTMMVDYVKCYKREYDPTLFPCDEKTIFNEADFAGNNDDPSNF